MFPYGQSRSTYDKSDMNKAYSRLDQLRDRAREDLYARAESTSPRSTPRYPESPLNSRSRSLSMGYPASPRSTPRYPESPLSSRSRSHSIGDPASPMYGGRSLASSSGAYDDDSTGFTPSMGYPYADSSAMPYPDTFSGPHSQSPSSYGRFQNITNTPRSYMDVIGSPNKRPVGNLPGSRSADSLSKCLSDCPDCVGSRYYCYLCSPSPGKRVVRPASEREREREYLKSPGTAVADRRPRATSRLPTVVNASPHLAPVRLGDKRNTESPYGRAHSFNGTAIWSILDSGAASTSVSAAFLRRAYPGIRIFRDQKTVFHGVGGGTSVGYGRVDLKMLWTGVDGRQVQTNGEAWVTEPGDMEMLNCDVLLGLPYMRDNGMNLIWSDIPRQRFTTGRLQHLGDKLVIKGVTVEIYITH